MHKMIEAAEEKHRDFCEIKDKLTTWLNEEVEKGRVAFNTAEGAAVADIIKDLAEAEEKCWKACYYASVVKYMHEEYDDNESERHGYDHYRYPSSGRFASTGHGRRYGYMPHIPHGMDMWDTKMMRETEMMEEGRNPRMGYTGDGDGDRMGATHMRGRHIGRYGYSYENYRDRRRNYTDTHNQKDKEEMDSFAHEHISDTLTTMRDIWKHADPELKARMKTDLSNLIGEMNS